jgi:hypothetical protein
MAALVKATQPEGSKPDVEKVPEENTFVSSTFACSHIGCDCRAAIKVPRKEDSEVKFEPHGGSLSSSPSTL